MLESTWSPREMAGWTAPGGPLAGTGTLAELCVPGRSGRGASGPRPGDEDRLVLVDGADRRWAGDLTAAVDIRVTELAGEGIGPGDVVRWQAANVAASVIEYLACWSIGAVAAPIHHLAGPAQVDQITASLGLVPPPATDTRGGHRLSPASVTSVESHGDTGGPVAGSQEVGSQEVGGQMGGRRVRGSGQRESEIAVVLHTSGSSGNPKGVMHTHRSLAYKARSIVDVHGLGSDDVVLMPAPLAHVSGLLNGILVPAAARMTTVLMSKWSPEVALDLIESEQVSFMVGPPAFFIGLEQAQGFDPSRVASLRLLSLGGAGVTPEFVRHAATTFDAEVKRTYGSTEAPTVSTSTPADDDETRWETDGRAVGAVRLRTVLPTTGTPAGTRVPGEVQVSGPELFAGYLDPDRTAEATVSDEDGDWFRTGDLGTIDERGRLTITGRLRDVIIRGGENIDPATVEAHVVAHPAVAHAVVVGEPDERLGERVCAFVELAGTPGAGGESPIGFDVDQCRDWFAERGVTRFMTPERVVVLDQLPLLPSGKADRAAFTRRATATATATAAAAAAAEGDT